MKQLEMSTFGVLEMQQEEMREIDGGEPVTFTFWAIGTATALFIMAATEIVQDWEGFKSGLKGTREPKK